MERMYLKRYILSLCFVDIHSSLKGAVTLGPLVKGGWHSPPVKRVGE